MLFADYAQLLKTLCLILLLAFAATSAHRAEAAILSIKMGAFESWLLRFSDYLSVLVVPYLAPIVVAFAVHDELRRAVFGWTTRDKGQHGKSARPFVVGGLSRKLAR